MTGPYEEGEGPPPGYALRATWSRQRVDEATVSYAVMVVLTSSRRAEMVQTSWIAEEREQW